MCGLITIIAADSRPDLGAIAQRMLKLIAHRGPDGQKVIEFDHAGPIGAGAAARIVLAHARLAIQDVSDAGLQPMATPDGHHWLSYNGEIYNFRELQAKLARQGVSFRSGCDTEVLLHMLSRHGRDALALLDGMFAFSLLDLHARRLTIARDRFGIKPLYYWQPNPRELCIASEIKAFTAHPHWQPRVRIARAFDYLNRGVIDHHPGETMFEGVHCLPPGTLAQISLDGPLRVEPERWFDLETYRTNTPHSLRALLERSVRRRLIADVPIGSCLSGGLDSSSIVALASHTGPNANGVLRLQTIHARPEQPDLDESKLARAAAEHAGADLHEVVPRGCELFDRLDELVWVHDEPFGSPSIFAQFKVFELAHQLGLKVMLDGQGADEQLAGYDAFFKAALAEHFSHGRMLKAHVHAHSVRHLHGTPLLKQIAYAVAALAPAPFRRRARPPSVAVRGLDDWIDPFDAMPHGARSVRGLSIDQLLYGSLPMLLHWEDRNSMHFGVEARVPFLNHDLVAASLALPADDKIRRGVTKWALRDAVGDLLPDLVRSRTDKLAFSTPEATWVRGDPRSRKLLECGLETASLWMDDAGRERLRAMFTGGRDYDNAVWRVICFGAWAKRFAVSI